MKKFFGYSFLALLCTAPCFAGIDYSTSRIGFEVQNKARRPIWVALVNGQRLNQPTKVDEIDVKGLKKIVPTVTSSHFKLDITQPTKLAVYYQDPGFVEYGKTKLGGLVGKEGFIPTPNKVYSFTPGKTIYLTWDASNFPRPQTGKRAGLAGETESGLSLANNLTPTDIKEEVVS